MKTKLRSGSLLPTWVGGLFEQGFSYMGGQGCGLALGARAYRELGFQDQGSKVQGSR